MGGGAALTPEPSTTARSLLVAWANQQDAWVRQLVSDVIVSRKSLIADQLDAIYDTFLREKALLSGEAVAVPKLIDNAFSSDNGVSLALTKLHDLHFVNALAEDQCIDFNFRLTIVFGENACGKTGYVRVLKKAAAVRTAETVLPNLSAAKPVKQLPQARITFQLGTDQPQEVIWQDQAGLIPLNRIDVFDSRATTLHVDGDLNYVYTPGELSRFPLVQQATEGVRARLESAIRDATLTGNPFISHFDRQSPVYPHIDSLGAATDIRELTQLSSVTADERDALPGLREEIEALQTTNPSAQLKLAESLRQHLAAINSTVAALARFDTQDYAKKLAAYRTAEKQYDNVTRESFAGLPIPGILKNEWTQFIQAGDAYLKTLENSPAYPNDSSDCLYCRQSLSSGAVALLKKYREYCNSTARAELNTAQRLLDEVTRQFEQSAALVDAERSVNEVETGGAIFSTEQLAAFKALLTQGASIRDKCKARDSIKWPSQSKDCEAALQFLEDSQAHNRSLIADLTERSDKRESALQERKSRLLNIESRLTLNGLLPEITKAVENAKWADKAKIQQKKFPTLLRSLTETSKAASEQLLNRDFETHFTEECNKLRAPKVALLFPGKQGQVTRKKSVATGEHRPSDVLSEGEQKVIALADFLAESALKPPAPVIFDDPINSLDYKRMGEVVSRIVNLSESRQVIVFTHNIWFATELLASFEKQPQHCSYYDVSRDGVRIGVVSKGTHPRSDTFANLKSRINSLIQTAEKSSGEAQSALIEKAYELVRNICEVVVEKDLLQGVTQRYQPNVMMTRLPEINFAGLQKAVNDIYPIYEDSCRYIGSHSQPMETLNVRPSIESLKKDWQTVQTLRDAYIKKK
jgi:hypothetical protein